MDSEYTIRRLTVGDADAILAFLLALDEGSVEMFHPHVFDLNHVLRLLGGGLAGHVDGFGAFACRDGALAGYVWLSGMEGLHPSLGLCVGGDHRGRGLGRALLRRAVDEATLRGKREVCLTVMASNDVALRLYRSLGFEIVDEASEEAGHCYGMTLRCPTSATDRAPTIRERLRGLQVMVVPYTHCDWAWVHTRHWHAQRYALVFAETLAVMDRCPEYRWYCDNFACQFQALLDLRPDLLEPFRRRVAEGRIDVCGGYSNVRPNMVGDETFVRSMTLGRREWQRWVPEGRLEVHADAVDVAVGHPQMPQLLRLGGYRYLRMWRPYSALSLKGVPNDFVWQGLDGSEVLVSRGCYGGLFARDERSGAIMEPDRAAPDDLLCALWDADLEARCRYAGAPLAWLAIGCDDARPLRLIDDTPFDVPALIDAWNRQEVGDGVPPMRFATPSDYFAELERSRDSLRTIVGTLDPCDVAYNCAWNGEKGLGAQRIRNDRLLAQAEMWRSLAACHGLEYPEQAFVNLWKEHLLTCAHATQWLYAPDFAEMRERADRVGLDATRLRDEALDALVRAADPPEDAVYVVANPLPYTRTAVVEATLSCFGGGWPAMFTDGEGRSLAAQTLHEHRGQGGYEEQLQAVAVELPACGLAIVRQRPCEAPPNVKPPARPRMDNGRLKLKLKEGRVVGITDRSSQFTHEAPLGLEWGGLVFKEVATSEGPLHVGPIRAEHVFEWERGEFRETGPVRWKYRRVGRAAGLEALMEVSLEAGSPRLDFDVEIDWPGLDGFLAARFPLPIPCRMYGDIPFGVERKDIAAEPYGKDHWVSPHSMERTREGLFYARSFVAVERPDGACFAVVAGNTDRYYLRQCTGRYLEHLLINSVATLDEWEHQVEPSTITGAGMHHFRFSLLAYSGEWSKAGVVREAASARIAPIVREVVRHRATDAGHASGEATLSVEPEGVELSALYREGDDLILRIYELRGLAARAEVVLPIEVVSATRTDFNGREATGPAPIVAGRRLQVGLQPWEIATLRLKTGTTSRE